jgi:hypothetical protein
MKHWRRLKTGIFISDHVNEKYVKLNTGYKIFNKLIGGSPCISVVFYCFMPRKIIMVAPK